MFVILKFVVTNTVPQIHIDVYRCIEIKNLAESIYLVLRKIYVI